MASTPLKASGQLSRRLTFSRENKRDLQAASKQSQRKSGLTELLSKLKSNRSNVIMDGTGAEEQRSETTRLVDKGKGRGWPSFLHFNSTTADVGGGNTVEGQAATAAARRGAAKRIPRERMVAAREYFDEHDKRDKGDDSKAERVNAPEPPVEEVRVGRRIASVAELEEHMKDLPPNSGDVEINIAQDPEEYTDFSKITGTSDKYTLGSGNPRGVAEHQRPDIEPEIQRPTTPPTHEAEEPSDEDANREEILRDHGERSPDMAADFGRASSEPAPETSGFPDSAGRKETAPVASSEPKANKKKKPKRVSYLHGGTSQILYDARFNNPVAYPTRFDTRSGIRKHPTMRRETLEFPKEHYHPSNPNFDQRMKTVTTYPDGSKLVKSLWGSVNSSSYEDFMSDIFHQKEPVGQYPPEIRAFRQGLRQEGGMKSHPRKEIYCHAPTDPNPPQRIENMNVPKFFAPQRLEGVRKRGETIEVSPFVLRKHYALQRFRLYITGLLLIGIIIVAVGAPIWYIKSKKGNSQPAEVSDTNNDSATTKLRRDIPVTNWVWTTEYFVPQEPSAIPILPGPIAKHDLGHATTQKTRVPSLNPELKSETGPDDAQGSLLEVEKSDVSPHDSGSGDPAVIGLAMEELRRLQVLKDDSGASVQYDGTAQNEETPGKISQDIYFPTELKKRQYNNPVPPEAVAISYVATTSDSSKGKSNIFNEGKDMIKNIFTKMSEAWKKAPKQTTPTPSKTDSGYRKHGVTKLVRRTTTVPGIGTVTGVSWEVIFHPTTTSVTPEPQTETLVTATITVERTQLTALERFGLTDIAVPDFRSLFPTVIPWDPFQIAEIVEAFNSPTPEPRVRAVPYKASKKPKAPEGRKSYVCANLRYLTTLLKTKSILLYSRLSAFFMGELTSLRAIEPSWLLKKVSISVRRLRPSTAEAEARSAPCEISPFWCVVYWVLGLCDSFMVMFAFTVAFMIVQGSDYFLPPTILEDLGRVADPRWSPPPEEVVNLDWSSTGNDLFLERNSNIQPRRRRASCPSCPLTI